MKEKYYKSSNVLILIVVLIFSFGKGNASHIIGGNISYECLGQTDVNGIIFNDFQITMTMFRDCRVTSIGAQLDNPAVVGIYTGKGENWEHKETFRNVLLSELKNINLKEDPCIKPPPNLCVQRGTYIFNVQLEVSDNNYKIVYQKCCRNNTILNIIDPGITGAAFEVEISSKSQEICNNSPVFDNFPPMVVCVGNELIFNHSATDSEGNDLVYEFCAPLKAAGPEGSNGYPGNAFGCNGVAPDPASCPPQYDDVIFNLPNFTKNMPLGLNSPTELNAFTGVLKVTPSTIGQYVLGVCVKEYSNGELLSVIRRDFQFNVTECEIQVEASIKNDAVIKEQEYLVNSCGDLSIDFINLSEDRNKIKGYYWEFDLGNGQTATGNERDITVTFPKIGSYQGTMILNPDNTGCTDTATVRVDINPEINADWAFVYDTCSAGPITFNDFSVSGSGFISNWNWDFEGNIVGNQNPIYQYTSPGTKDVTLEVIDINDCRDTLNKSFDWYPSPNEITVEPNRLVGCSPVEIKFNNLTYPIDSTYDIFWNFGDGSSGTEISPFHTYKEIGNYTVNLEVISPFGCEAYKEYPYLIQVAPGPNVDFSYSPEIVTSDENIVDFKDLSDNAISWQYIINDSLASYYSPNATHEFKDTGLYKVDLIGIHPSGCADTITKYIDVIPKGTLYFPSAFSPNGDGNNDIFKPKGNGFGIKNYNMSVYNRWGERIFVSEDFNKGWNGRVNNEGGEVPSGVYIYQVNFIEPRWESISLKGTATIVK